MNIYPDLNQWHAEFTALRRDLHAHPEIGFEEFRTGDLIAAKLAEIGVDSIERNWAKTGIVATIHGKTGAANDPDRAIALRTDIDALPIIEETNLPYASTINGRMHACGHDGHTAMLLMAAKYLTTHRNFSGSVHLIFQPAEENGGGGNVMVQEGFFEKFPVKSAWGMHNWPSMPFGMIGLRSGPMMAAYDQFKITVHGKGGHAARPHVTLDPIVIGAQLVTALQTIVSRNVNPVKEAVVSVTQFHAGFTSNVIVERAELQGTLRSFDPEIRKLLVRRVNEVCDGIAKTFNAKIDLTMEHGYPSTINTPEESTLAKNIACEILGESKVDDTIAPSMGAEDFSYFLQKVPGCYIRLGTGKTDSDPDLHHPKFNFNDEALPIGAMYWVKLVEKNLHV